MSVKVFKCLRNIVIGNGAGKWEYTDNSTYTDRDLMRACLTKSQVKAYFKEVDTANTSARRPAMQRTVKA